MSALPPRADLCSAVPDVRFGPIGDIAECELRYTRGGLDGAINLNIARAPVRMSLGSSVSSLAGVVNDRPRASRAHLQHVHHASSRIVLGRSCLSDLACRKGLVE